MRNHSRPPLGSVVEGRYIVLVQKTGNLYLSDAGRIHLVDLLDNASAVAIDDKVPLIASSDEGEPSRAFGRDRYFSFSCFLPCDPRILQTSLAPTSRSIIRSV